MRGDASHGGFHHHAASCLGIERTLLKLYAHNGACALSATAAYGKLHLIAHGFMLGVLQLEFHHTLGFGVDAQVVGYVGVCAACREGFLAVFLWGVRGGYGIVAASAKLHPRLQVGWVDVFYVACELVGFPFGRAVAGHVCGLVGQHNTCFRIRQSALFLLVEHGFYGGRKGVFSIIADVIYIHRVAYGTAVRAEVSPVGLGFPICFCFLAVVRPLLVLYACF